jgi:hypothetical protein
MYQPGSPPKLSTPTKPYSPGMLYCFIGAYIFFWFLVLEGLGQRSLLQFSLCFCLGLIVSLLLLDLRGFLTLQGALDLRGAGAFYILFCLCILPIWTGIYLTRTSQAYKRPPLLHAAVRQSVAMALVAGLAGTLIFYVAVANVTASPTASTPLLVTPTTSVQSLAQVDTATPTQTTSLPFTQSTSTPASLPPPQTTQPTTSLPQSQQTTQPPAPQPTQASTPERTGWNGNPWGFDFNPANGQRITNPPPAFCTAGYFLCIPNFSNGTGYVVQCRDGKFSKSGGRPGSCSQHGGELQTLYAH